MACLATASADLRITEAMSSSLGGSTKDWIEITNYGLVTVSLDDAWRVDDSSASYNVGASIGGLASLAPGSSAVIILESDGADARFDGFLNGSGDFIVDSPGTGLQILNTSPQTLADGVVKDYTGRTIVRDGGLAVNASAIPTDTSEIRIEGGRLVLTTDAAEYFFGLNSGAGVTLASGAIEQEIDESVTLDNDIAVAANSMLRAFQAAGSGVLRLTGALTGSSGLAIEGGGTVVLDGEGDYSGTLDVKGSVLRVNGGYTGAKIVVDADASVGGQGIVDRIGGAGKVTDAAAAAIFTTMQADVSSGLDFQFKFVQQSPDFLAPAASENGVLRVTAPIPLHPVRLRRISARELSAAASRGSTSWLCRSHGHCFCL
jgi:hypothetical protein